MAPAATAAPGQAPSEKQPKLRAAAPASLAGTQEKGTVVSLGEGAGKALYLVQLESAAVPSYDGGVKGLAPVQAAGRTFAPDAARERAYRDYVVEEQADLRRDIAGVTGRAPQVKFSYTDALNGLAVSLTRDEARQVAEIDGVAAVQVDEVRQLQTDVGPEWIGAPSIWDGSATPSGAGTRGEGVIAGVLDSGVNAANPSFADSVPVADGGDGYDHENPLGAGTYVGVCDPANVLFYNPDFGCNDKLIGAWDFASGDNAGPNGVGYAYDENGHGTHTASTTAGNQVDATTFSAEENPAERFSATRNIKGVAPHANVITSDVCAGGCPMSAIVAGIDQAIDDGVDVINYSIGSAAASNPWSDPDGLGFLNARAAGIHVATSAGNDGPGSSTVGSPADVPWITSVGATQHNRQWQATVENITADGTTHPDIAGLAFANASDGTFPLVDAADLGSNLCLAAELAGKDLTGQIVVCERGNNGRVEKGEVLAALGAEGMVLMNDEASGDSLNADPHALPAVHISYADGVELEQWMDTVTGEQASLSGGTEVIGDELADIMAGFSSRGPNRAVEMISPSLSAPGVDILAGNGRNNEVSWGFISGTSMASPHVAGAFALIAAENPDWTPAEAQSALMTTAVTAVTDNDGSEADWLDMGSGRVDLTKAADAGLVLDETEADYLAADPTVGGDVKELNTASMASSQCLEECSWTRTVSATETGAGTWTTEGSGVTDGIAVSVEPATFTLAEGESQDITITANVAGASTEDYQFGNVVLTPAAGSKAPAAHLPVAALPSTGIIPAEIDIDTRRDAGSQESEPIEAVQITDLDIEANGLVPATVQGLSIEEDSTNPDPFDGNGTEVIDVTVPQGATRLIANLTDATAPDFDLYVGTGEVAAENVVATSASGGSAESVDIALGDGDAGNWWILVQNWQASTPGGTDTVDLEHAVVSGDAGNLRAEGPASQPAGEPFTIRTFWDESRMRAGQTWYGSLTLSAAPGGSTIGTIPVTVDRLQDDVTKSVDSNQAAPGETLTYTVEVQPNVTPEDLTYTFRDQLPKGTTYVEGSGPEGATLEGNVLTWEQTMPTPVGAEGDYTITTSAQDEECVNPFTGDASFQDLFDFGDYRDPAITGDGNAWSAFTGRSYGFYEGTYSGLTLTDDGFLVYGPQDNYGGAPSVPQQVPSPAQPNNLAAFLWQDMQVVFDEASQAGVSLATAGDLAVVQYDDLRLADDPTGAEGLYDVQVWQQTGSRDVVAVYGDVTGPVNPVTIGTENSAGDQGTALVNAGDASSVVAADTVVCMAYAGAEFAAETFTYQVTVDDDVLDGQELRNRLTHTVDNPGARAVQVSSFASVIDGAQAPAVKVIKKRDARERGADGVVMFKRPRAGSDERLTVFYDVRGTAVAGRDYRPLDGSITFRPGKVQAREFVQARNRKGQQGVRRVRIVLTEGDRYTVGSPKVAVVQIRDARRRR
ncbi:MAG: S8 family serine peptidase [Nocardioides sp.]